MQKSVEILAVKGGMRTVKWDPLQALEYPSYYFASLPCKSTLGHYAL